MSTVQEIARGVYWCACGFANVYFLGAPGEPWFLVDTGIAGDERRILKAAEKIYGSESRPEAILLTHGHGDHSGSSARLAENWDVSVYAHKLERPYLTGLCSYPPMDPTIGGFAGFASRFVPMARVHLGRRLVDLADDGTLPGATPWRWLQAVGHSPGHVAFYREEDGVLIAGDAFATLKLSSLVGNVLKLHAIQGAPEASTSDWAAAEATVYRLAQLAPKVLACGHGRPFLEDDNTALQLSTFAAIYKAPTHGRYTQTPALSDETGVVSLPPAPLDPLRPLVAGVAVVSIGICAWLFAKRSHVTRKDDSEAVGDANGQDNQ